MLKDLWSKGVADAGYSLFSIYYNGFGADDNRKTALSYLKGSAEKGYALSQRTLAEAYQGEDYAGLVVKDYDKAMHWYKKAVEQGDKKSAMEIASLYYYGKGVEKVIKRRLTGFCDAVSLSMAMKPCVFGHFLNSTKKASVPMSIWSRPISIMTFKDRPARKANSVYPSR